MTAQRTYHAASSSGGEYVLTLSIAGGRAKLECGCQAGQTMMMCKHRLALLRGDAAALCGDISTLAEDLARAEVVALRADCDSVCGKMDALEAEKKRIDQEIKKLKKELAWRVTTGAWK